MNFVNDSNDLSTRYLHCYNSDIKCYGSNQPLFLLDVKITPWDGAHI